MMPKIHILSDLHLEFAPFKPPETEANIVVLAGDIHLGQKGKQWAKQSFPDKTIIYVLGNHEYYGNAIPKLTNKIREAGTHLHILENERLEIEGLTFLGCTLWTDFKLFGDPRIAGYHAQTMMNDYHKIRVSPEFRKLRAIDTALFHSRSLKWLQNELLNVNPQKTIVITHHAPSLYSIPVKYRSDLLSAAFASALDDFVINSGVSLWIHGHIHDNFDYKLGNTRVVCNPRGYPDEKVLSFNPEFII
jgi:Icc-related predicted phosphoesterase